MIGDAAGPAQPTNARSIRRPTVAEHELAAAIDAGNVDTLVIIGGNDRGKEYMLIDGDNVNEVSNAGIGNIGAGPNTRSYDQQFVAQPLP